ncbi:hypothetical protein FRB99_001232 [Tulasnella sp. 403]|nr:hypothetical protein FRB99_001232 [Tulasnella sp. 403]
MSGRMRFQEWDGTSSSPTSALETAIDQHCTIFLSSNESQHVVNSLWRGDWIQQNNDKNDIDYVLYRPVRNSIWDRIDPSRICVPRYQNWFRIIIWFFFLFTYSQAVQQPLEMTLEPRHSFDAWEYILYGMALAFTFEDIDKIYATLRFFTYRALSFWHLVSVTTDAMLVTAFIFRITGIKLADDDHAAQLKLQSFQVLSLKLITVADGFKYIGTMQICIARMLKESGIFFVLLAVVGAGFVQSMYAIDAADGHTDRGFLIINNLIQGLLGSPDFGNELNSWALFIFYLWNVFTTIILLNILISLFSSAYDDVTNDASAHFLAFFAGKTVAMIRAPDQYVYPAPFNLIELFFVAPTEWFISKKAYGKYNRIVMRVLLFIPLIFITFFESQLDVRANAFMKNMFDHVDEGEEDDPAIQDPATDREDGLEISRVSFDELVKVFPNTFQSSEATILSEIHALSVRLDEMEKRLGIQAETKE